MRGGVEPFRSFAGNINASSKCFHDRRSNKSEQLRIITVYRHRVLKYVNTPALLSSH